MEANEYGVAVGILVTLTTRADYITPREQTGLNYSDLKII